MSHSGTRGTHSGEAHSNGFAGGEPANCFALFLMAMALCLPVSAQSQGRYRPVFENDLVVAYDVSLPPHASARALSSENDNFWIALDSSDLSFARNQLPSADGRLQTGDMRFFPSFDLKQVTNNGAHEFRAVLVLLKQHGRVTGGCDCNDATSRSICGCPGGNHLTALWAIGLSAVTVSGTTLSAGESFRGSAARGDMLVVAVSDLDLLDEAGDPSASTEVKLMAGEAAWIRSGHHQFRNRGSQAARFVSFEF